MSHTIINWLYEPLKEHEIYEDFMDWAKKKELLPRRKLYETIEDNEGIMYIIDVIKQYADEKVHSEEIKHAIYNRINR